MPGRTLILGAAIGLLLLLSDAFAFQSSESSHLTFQSRIRLFASSVASVKPKSPGDGNDDLDICRQTLELALAKMAVISEPDFATRFHTDRARLVEVKESSISGAGLGLFAKKNIKAGTIVSFYPAHTIGIILGDSIRRISRNDSGSMCEQQQEEDETTASNQTYLHHVLGSRPLFKVDIAGDLGGDSIFLDVDLSQPERTGFASHRINDGATVMANSEDGVLAYYCASRRSKNCVIVPFGPSPLLATVTTKKLKKGEELFTTYGCSYWLESLLKETGEAEETDTTDSIILEAREVAMDVLTGMRSAAVRNANEEAELQAIFDLPLEVMSL